MEKVLDPEASGYSDVAVGDNGIIYCLYESRPPGEHYNIALKKFNLAWLTNGNDVWSKK